MRRRSLRTILATLQAEWKIVASIMGAGIVLALGALLVVHAKYIATATVLMVAEPPESQNPQVPISATKPLLSADLPLLATSTTVLTRLRDDLHETITLEKLSSRVRAKMSSDSNVMPLQYSGKSKEGAIRGANALADEVTRFYREIATRRFDSLIKDLNAQLALRRSDLTRLDSQLDSLARIYPFIDVKSTETGGDANAYSVYQRRIALQNQSAELQAAVNADTTGLKTAEELVTHAEPVAIHDLSTSDPVYQNLREQYAQDAATLQHEEAFGSERYPGLSELRDIVAKEHEQVVAEARKAIASGLTSDTTYADALDEQAKAQGQLASDRAKAQAIQQQMDALDAQLGGDRVAATVARIRRDRDSAENAYAIISARLSKTIADRAEAASTGSVVVMDYAHSAQKAVWTSGSFVATAILLLSLWLSVTVPLNIEKWREDTAEEDSLPLPVRGSFATEPDPELVGEPTA